MLPRCYLALTVVVALLSWAEYSNGCPEPTGWFYSAETKMCYKGLLTESLTFFEAQSRCNQLRSNLFQFKAGDTKQNFDNLQQSLYDFRNTSEFRVRNWIGLTDRAVQGEYVYLNNFPLNSIAPNTLISCPDETPNCKKSHRCVYLHLEKRGSSNKQVFNGDCSAKFPPICYAPVGGTDVFDKIPALGASSVVANAVLMSMAFSFAAALKSMGVY